MATSTSRRAAGAATGSQSAKKPQQPTMSKFRLLLVWAVLVLGQLGIACRLVYLQVIAAPSLQQQARSQQRTSLSPFIPRRAIIDRNGNVLAIDQSVYTLYAHPVQFKDKPEVKDVHEAVALKLAPILGRSPTDLQRLLKSADSGIPVARALSEQVADQIKLLGLDGLELIRQRQRLYPQQGLTSGIIGYVNTEHKGQAGIEYSQQKMLEPALRSAKVSLDAKGHLLPDHIPANLLQTDDLRLQLTLDTQIQQAARAALSQQLQKYRAQRGTVIVMDAQDGSLLALVSEPTFNPNHYYQSDPELFKNWALSDLYEPGSTFKPINVAIALETGAIRADSVFNDEGRISVGGWPIQNNDYADKGARGLLSVSRILELSSNVGMVHIAEQMQPAVYYDWLARLGIGKLVNSDLPFATPGQFKNKDQFIRYPIEPATTSFGQGFSVTPIQMAQLHAAIANGGKLVTPHVIRGLANEAGALTWKPKLSVQQIFSSTTTQAVLSMMGNVVAHGTGKAAQIPGYRLGGKTGTAQKASGGRYNAARITSFVGIFPLASPRYVVLAVVDEPKGEDAYGSTVAAPIVKSVIEALVPIEGIPPTQPWELQPIAQQK